MEAIGGSAPDLLIAAFLSMQPPSMVVSFARDVGGGFVSDVAQQFFLDKCFNNEVHLRYPSSQPYVKRVVKEIILAAEKDGQEVMESLYDLHLILLDSDKGLPLAERCHKTFCFMIPESARPNLIQTLGEEVASELIGMKLLTVRISLDLLDGDTGYCVWPAGLFLAEVLLSHPQLVRGKSCLELGSGTGICGIWLSMLAPSKAVLTDGSLPVLVNLRHNLAINGIPLATDEKKPSLSEKNRDGNVKVECRRLLWEIISEEELQTYKAQVIIGGDLVYDPTIVPYLVQTLAMLLRRKSSSRQGLSKFEDLDDMRILKSEDEVISSVAYLAVALRNLTTLHLFFRLAGDASLQVTDVTESFMPLRILPDIFDRSQVRLYQLVPTYVNCSLDRCTSVEETLLFEWEQQEILASSFCFLQRWPLELSTFRWALFHRTAGWSTSSPGMRIVLDCSGNFGIFLLLSPTVAS